MNYHSERLEFNLTPKILIQILSSIALRTRLLIFDNEHQILIKYPNMATPLPTPILSVQTSVMDGLGQVLHLNLIRACQICNGAAYF